jgi:hypothetical protein
MRNPLAGQTEKCSRNVYYEFSGAGDANTVFDNKPFDPVHAPV